MKRVARIHRPDGPRRKGTLPRLSIFVAALAGFVGALFGLMGHIVSATAANTAATTDMREVEIVLRGGDKRSPVRLHLPGAYIYNWLEGNDRPGNRVILLMRWPDLRPYSVVVQEAIERRPNIMNRYRSRFDGEYAVQHEEGLFKRRLFVEIEVVGELEKVQHNIASSSSGCVRRPSDIPG